MIPPRWLLVLIVAAACAAPHARAARPVDDELGAPPAAAPAPTAPTAPAPGKALRAGTITRGSLVAVLDAGPAQFLRQLEVAPQLAGDRFVGWQLVQLLDHAGPLHDVDLAPGDVLLAINGQPVARPEQLATLWESLRAANELRAQLRRGAAPFELRFQIDPPAP
jgi:S1-C subfamily serine protease